MQCVGMHVTYEVYTMARCEWVMTASIGPGQEIVLEKRSKTETTGQQET